MGWNGFALSMHMDSPIDPATGRPASGEVSVGFGRIVASEIEAPNMLANLVWNG